MPVLDTATAQKSLQSYLSPLRAQPTSQCKVFSSSSIFGEDTRSISVWKYFRFPKKLNACERSRLQIKAVATLEPKSTVHKDNGKSKESVLLDGNSNVSTVQADTSNVGLSKLDEHERLRRMRISKANKGNTPWNKGRKHSPETIRKIRERTRLAMQNPKVKKKLANLGHAQSKETRTKIGASVRLKWQQRREKMDVQETCFYEWQNFIAEASRKGLVGEEELQWNSYEILTEKLAVEWAESVEQRKSMPRPKGSKRAPKSPEQRRKIAEAIAAKWADPDYRQRVFSGLSKYHGARVGVEPRRRPSTQSRKQDPAMKTSNTKNLSRSGSASTSQRPKLRRSKRPLYRDPLASSKLEMIKNIRAGRAATETKMTEAVERARLLIAEAQKAAKVLEVAAIKSPVAQASLLETRKLIAEAIHLIESIDAGYRTPIKDDTINSVAPELVEQVDMEIDVDNENSSQAELEEVRRTVLASGKEEEDFNFTNVSLHDILNGDNELLFRRSSGFSLPPIKLESILENSNSPKRLAGLETNGSIKLDKNIVMNESKVKEELLSKTVTRTKKWVRGRLVEVTEGD